MQVELVYEKTCPNIEAARTQLLRAFVEAGATPHWLEWEVSTPDAPAHIHGFGSPSILIDGQDVSGDMAEGNNYCCRVYSHGNDASKGVPAMEDIVHAITSAQQTLSKPQDEPRWQLNGAMLPAIGMAFLPKLACPACWPAYAGLLSSLGIGFIDYTSYLLPLTGGFLVIALVALAYRAQQRRGYKPLLVGMLAGAILIIGKFYFDSDVTMYIGLALLVMASLWNTWPKPHTTDKSCPACVTLSQEQLK